MTAIQEPMARRSAAVAGPLVRELRARWWAEHWTAAAVAGLTLVLTLLPPTSARLLGPQDRVHIGTYWFAWDFGQYRAAMNEGARSDSWLIHDHFSAEPHEPVFMYPLYVGIGKVAAAAGVPAMAVHGAVEVAARLLLVGALYWFVAAFSPERSARLLGLVLGTFAAGANLWVSLPLAVVTGYRGPPETGPTNPYVEFFTFGAFLAAPHVMLGLAATLAALAAFGRALSGGRWAVAAVGASALTLSLLHPFNLPTLLGALGLFAALAWLVESRGGPIRAGLEGERTAARGVVLRAAAATGVATLAAGPMLVYSVVTFAWSPFWSETYGAQNVLPSPSPWLLPTTAGIVLPLALAGAWSLRRSRSPAQAFLLVWVLVAGLAMYAPVPYQRRLGLGWMPALAALAGIGWPTWNAWAQRAAQRLPLALRRPAVAVRLARYPLLVFAFTDTLVAYLVVLLSTVGLPTERPSLFALDRDTEAVGHWLAERTGPEDVVLASLVTSTVLGGEIPGRVVAAHSVATLGLGEKAAAISAIYRGEATEAETRRFLAANRVTYVIVGPEERRVGSHDPGRALGLAVAVQVGQTIAYHVSPPR